MESPTRSSPQVNLNAALTQFALNIPYDPDDAYVAVMGVTGSGKSTFISRLCGEGPKIGHGLESCTAEIEVFSFNCDGRRVHLIDTLGFNDTYRTDSDVLKDLVFWLNKSYEHKIRLSGIVYLHPIHETRMTGASRKNMKIFRQLCGDSNLQSVVLATTMWKASTNETTRRNFEKRQEDIRLNPEYWGEMTSHGSPVIRHDDNAGSALSIVRYILKQDRRTVLQVQREMMQDGKRLDETLAGQELNRELLKQRRDFEKKLREAQEELKEAKEEGNKRAIQRAAEEKERSLKQLELTMKGSEELKISMDKIVEQKESERLQLQKELDEIRARLEKQTPPPAYEVTEDPTRWTFRKAFKESLGSSLGKSLATGAGVAGAVGGAAATCNVM